MNSYEKLLQEVDNIVVDDNALLPENYKGLYVKLPQSDIILLDKNLTGYVEKRCVLVEEIGHYKTTYGDITNQTKISNRKMEKIAKRHGYNKLITPENLINAFEYGIRNRYELAEYLEVTEFFLQGAMKDFSRQYGSYYIFGNYTIYFEPLAILKMFDVINHDY